MKKFILFIILFHSTYIAFGQYITLTEIDEAGKSRVLNQPRQAIDFNSKLSIDINREKILESLGDQLASGGDKIDSLLELLRLYESYTKTLSREIDDYQNLFDQNLDSIPVAQLDEALRERASAGLAIVEYFIEDEQFMARWEEKLENFDGLTTNDEYRLLLELLAQEISFIESNLQEILGDAGYYFQLAGWFVNKEGTNNVHLEGFDDLPQAEYYHVERNRLYLTPEQLAGFQALQASFENMDKIPFTDKIIEALPGLLNSFLDEEALEEQFQRLVSEINNLSTNAQAEKARILQEAKLISENFKSLKEEIHQKIDQYTAPEGVTTANSKFELLQNFMADVNSIKIQIRNLTDDIKNLVTGIDIQSLGASANAIKTEFTNLQTMLTDQVADLVERSRTGIQIAIHGRKINTAALEISEKVLKLQLDQIPNSTVLDIHHVGTREQGDLLILKALLWKEGNKTPVAVETREFPVMNALPHMHMSIVYAFAKPNTPNTNFKGGPLVSILYKFKSHSLPYRNFLDAGIGLHAASYDFDNDDTPEFAGGIVGSIFRDYLQFGWGFNFNANKSYLFAGLRIPIPTSPVSLMGS